MTPSALVSRLAWIIGLRLVLLILLLLGVSVFYLRGELSQYPQSLTLVFATLAAGFAFAGVYAAWLRGGRALPALALTQIALDQVTWTVVVYVTGGPSSGATSFYALTCLVGAVLAGQRGASLAATLALGLFSALCVCLKVGVLHAPLDQVAHGFIPERVDIVYPLLVNTLGIAVVAGLSGYLAERLHSAGGALVEATRRAEEAEQLAALGALSAGLAHEIRNPLGSIRGSIEMLREAPGLTEEDRKLCDIVFREAERLNMLVGDMVDLSKRREPRAEATDVAALAQEVVALAEHAERGTDVRILYQGPRGPVRARCDGAQMRQVLWNLVRNAVQASAAGSVVRVGVSEEKSNVILSVSDEGPGIPHEDRDRIFDAFYTKRTHGTGIGLAVVRQIMTAHAPMGACIEVSGPETGGTTFTVTLSNQTQGLTPSLRPPSAPPLH